jgi:hypothetical protein
MASEHETEADYWRTLSEVYAERLRALEARLAAVTDSHSPGESKEQQRAAIWNENDGSQPESAAETASVLRYSCSFCGRELSSRSDECHCRPGETITSVSIERR